MGEPTCLNKKFTLNLTIQNRISQFGSDRAFHNFGNHFSWCLHTIAIRFRLFPWGFPKFFFSIDRNSLWGFPPSPKPWGSGFFGPEKWSVPTDIWWETVQKTLSLPSSSAEFVDKVFTPNRLSHSKLAVVRRTCKLNFPFWGFLLRQKIWNGYQILTQWSPRENKTRSLN